MKKILQSVVAVTATVLAPTGLAQPAAGTIQHEPVSCIVRDTHTRLEAGYPAGKDGRVYFRAAGSDDFYWVALSRGAGGALGAANLPKPHPSTEKIEYYVAAGDPLPPPSKKKKGDTSVLVPANEEKTSSYTPVVSTMTYCRNEALAVKQAPDTEKVSIALGLVRWGQAGLPQGFLKAGISSVILPNGATTTLAAAMKAGGTAAGAGSAGGGMSAAAAVGLGAAAAGAGVAAAGAGGSTTEDNGCSGFSEAKMQAVSQCYGVYSGNFTPTSTPGVTTVDLVDRRSGGCTLIHLVSPSTRTPCTMSITNSSIQFSSSIINGGGSLLQCVDVTSGGIRAVGGWSSNLMLLSASNFNSLCAVP